MHTCAFVSRQMEGMGLALPWPVCFATFALAAHPDASVRSSKRTKALTGMFFGGGTPRSHGLHFEKGCPQTRCTTLCTQ